MPKVEGGPKELNDMLETVYQAALKEYDGDEVKASAAAWAAAEKAGWHKNEDDEWVKKERKNEEASPMRLLSSPFDSKNEKIEIDGDLLVKGVRMLASGTWTDSAVQTPLHYPAATLEKYARNWSDTAGWTRHTGGFPRDATDKVAEILNPRYENGAVVADIMIYGDTSKGRDMAAQVKKGRVKYVSVEHTGDERYNASTRQLEATSINFSGFAFVNKGACKLCRINEAAPLEAVQDAPEPVVQVETMDTKELEAKVAEPVKAPVIPTAVDNSRELEQAEEIAKLRSDLDAMKSVKQELEAMKVFKQDVESLRAELKEVKSQPAAAPVAVAVPVIEKKVEHVPEFRVKFDKRDRIISQE